MNQIRVNYNKSTGEILGYYPEDIKYDFMPEPNIILNKTQYETIAGREDSYRIQNRRLVDISSTANYFLEKKDIFSELESTLDKKALDAKNNGIILVSGKYVVNAGWNSYYVSMQNSLSTDSIVALKTYFIENEKYYIQYTEYDYASAKKFLTTVLSGIDIYVNQTIPARLDELKNELGLIREKIDITEIPSFIERISFGPTINEKTNPSRLKS